MTRLPIYRGHGFYLRSDNFFEKLPLFASASFPYSNAWYLTDVYSKTSDGQCKSDCNIKNIDGTKHMKYQHDIKFLYQCLLWTSLSPMAHLRTLKVGNKIYKNELCLDKNTLAIKKLKKYKLLNYEKEILNKYNEILKSINNKEFENEYNPEFNYGTYQIDNEINIKICEKCNKEKKDHEIDNEGRYKLCQDEHGKNYGYKYKHGAKFNTLFDDLKLLLNKYYKQIIQPKLFKYELLK